MPVRPPCSEATPGDRPRVCTDGWLTPPGDVNLWPSLSGGEVIDLLGRLRGGLDERRRKALLDRFDLDPRKKGRAYSKGNRQRVALVAALASDVDLLILDEPTAGLDPLMESVFRERIQECRPRGRTLLLSSHILSEVEHLCDRVTTIKDRLWSRPGHWPTSDT
jgi:ABC-2 type transport system ATP-binding protein